MKASKTEHRVGKGCRFLPLFPELRKHLEAAFDLAPEGSEFVISRYRDSNANLRTQLMRIIKRAGLKPWPKPFQNLRSTRETELEAEFPLHVVCYWLGNSEKVARRHYLQVTDEHFAKAVSDKALHNPMQQTSEMGCSAQHSAALQDENPEKSDTSSVIVKLPVAEAGLEPAREFPPTGF